MIMDRIENASVYRVLGPAIAAALDYLRQTDFSQVPAGRHELDGDRLFSIVQHYSNQTARRGHLGGATGSTSTCSTLCRGGANGLREPARRLASRDNLTMPKRTLSSTMPKGISSRSAPAAFVIFTPDDIHAPGLAVTPSEASATVCKVVVKCRVQEQAGGLFP